MGGQSLARDGTVATLDQQWLEADTARKIYRVAAGTRWSTVIARLDALGFSPAVMQSNNDFGVASTFSVNAHGWPVPFSGCGSTVRALTMVLADGTVVTCSRTENADLFRHAMGGYGLFGVITELELDMVPNALLAPRFEEMSGLETRRAIRAAARVRPHHPDGLRADGRVARPLLRTGAADYLSAHRATRATFPRHPDPDSSAVPRAISFARRSSPTAPSVFAGGPRRGSGRASPATRRATA